jgi:two-component system, chemotaxis family, protein-glutamate methylesterase/glutaminase
MMTESIEESLWSTMRGMEESAMLMQHMARHFTEAGDADLAVRFEAKAEEARRRSIEVKELVMRHEQLSAEKFRRADPAA